MQIAVALPDPGVPAVPTAPVTPTGIGSWLVGHMTDAVGGLLKSICSDLLDQVAAPVLHYVLQTPDLLAEPTLRKMWLLSLAALLVCTGLLLAIAGLAMIPGSTSKLSMAARETLGGRLLACLLTASVSLPVMALEVGLANRLANVFVTVGGASGRHAVWSSLADLMHGDVGAGIGMLVVAAVGVVLLVVLIVLGLVRWATLWLLVVLAPLAMGFAGLPSGGSLARVWWRLQLTAVFLPVANAALLGTYAAMFASNHNSLVGALSGIAILALLTKLPAWIAGIAIGAEAHDVMHRLRRTHTTARSAVSAVSSSRAASAGAAAGPAGAAGAAAAGGAAARGATAVGVPRRVSQVRGTRRGSP